MSQFRETLDLRSASAWDKFSLSFGVQFEQEEDTPLNTLITDSKFYDPRTETTRGFEMRTILAANPSLKVGYHNILKASQDITAEELRRYRSDDDVRDKVNENPLQSVFKVLVQIPETESQESQERQKHKFKHTSAAVHAATTVPVVTVEHDQNPSSGGRPSTPQSRFAESSFETPELKRKISDTSFGLRSTETTPPKLAKPEASVQDLQNKFVETIINKVWRGQIDVPWAQGRKMFLDYYPYPSTVFVLTVEQITLRSNL
jgi:hypothetical protein